MDPYYPSESPFLQKASPLTLDPTEVCGLHSAIVSQSQAQQLQHISTAMEEISWLCRGEIRAPPPQHLSPNVNNSFHLPGSYPFLSNTSLT